jgi:hypothetical protein
MRETKGDERQVAAACGVLQKPAATLSRGVSPEPDLPLMVLLFCILTRISCI